MPVFDGLWRRRGVGAGLSATRDNVARRRNRPLIGPAGFPARGEEENLPSPRRGDGALGQHADEVRTIVGVGVQIAGEAARRHAQAIERGSGEISG